MRRIQGELGVEADFFFFKQKTAYEILRSDWSSDVCSSDLPGLGHNRLHMADHHGQRRPAMHQIGNAVDMLDDVRVFLVEGGDIDGETALPMDALERAFVGVLADTEMLVLEPDIDRFPMQGERLEGVERHGLADEVAL